MIFSVLTTVTLCDCLEEIGKYSFNTCALLQHITIPNVVKWIKDSAFLWCSWLTTVTFGDGRLQEIGDGAFQGGVKLGNN